jgi:hypothetical protein
MNKSYAELKDIWGRFVDGDRSSTENGILALLNGQGIGVRQDDGELKQLTVSKPTSAENALVIGLRYIKRDGTQTEDLFSLEEARPVERHYKGTLEQKWPEYGGTHKQQVLFTLVADAPTPLTPVNTITVVKDKP